MHFLSSPGARLPLRLVVLRGEGRLGGLHEAHCLDHVAFGDLVGHSNTSQSGAETKGSEKHTGRGEGGVLAVAGVLAHRHVHVDEALLQGLRNGRLLLLADRKVLPKRALNDIRLW